MTLLFGWCIDRHCDDCPGTIAGLGPEPIKCPHECHTPNTTPVTTKQPRKRAARTKEN